MYLVTNGQVPHCPGPFFGCQTGGPRPGWTSAIPVSPSPKAGVHCMAPIGHSHREIFWGVGTQGAFQGTVSFNGRSRSDRTTPEKRSPQTAADVFFLLSEVPPHSPECPPPLPPPCPGPVTHTELFPNASHLPTFSSPAIEAHLHRAHAPPYRWAPSVTDGRQSRGPFETYHSTKFGSCPMKNHSAPRHPGVGCVVSTQWSPLNGSPINDPSFARNTNEFDRLSSTPVWRRTQCRAPSPPSGVCAVIPGLSRRFLYLNDDTMFGNHIRPEDFYAPAAVGICSGLSGGGGGGGVFLPPKRLPPSPQLNHPETRPEPSL